MNIYLQLLLENVHRVLNQLDRNPHSPTYGCFDRDYWHYKIADFPCARKQEASLTLALLYLLEDKDNIYYHQPLIKEWSLAAVNFWSKMQNKNGSFNEWYPLENSFVATAFSTYAVTESFLTLNITPSENQLRSILKAAEFLAGSKEFRVQNQQAGAIAALYNCHLLTKRQKYASVAKKRVVQLHKYQSKEGWFHEYGGPDIGYLSLAIDYLGKYYRKSKDEHARTIIERAASFLKYFLHPDYTCGGVYTSRNTEYLIPSAFWYVHEEEFHHLTQFCQEGLRRRTLINPHNLDDRYLLYNGYTYLQAELSSREVKLLRNIKKPFSFELNYRKEFPECGLQVINTKNYFFITNLKKGGSFYFYSKPENKSISDSGIFATEVKEGKETYLTSSFLGTTERIELTEHHTLFKVSGHLNKIPSGTLKPAKNVLLRSFQLTVGRNEPVSRFIKEKLRDLLITPNRKSKTRFERSIKFLPDKVIIKDKIISSTSTKNVFVNCKQPVQYVPSARFFIFPEINSIPLETKEGKVLVRELK